jgi:hypothetical protein
VLQCYCRFSKVQTGACLMNSGLGSPFPGDETEILTDEPGQQMLCFDLVQAIESYCLLPPLRCLCSITCIRSRDAQCNSAPVAKFLGSVPSVTSSALLAGVALVDLRTDLFAIWTEGPDAVSLPRHEMCFKVSFNHAELMRYTRAREYGRDTYDDNLYAVFIGSCSQPVLVFICKPAWGVSL